MIFITHHNLYRQYLAIILHSRYITSIVSNSTNNHPFTSKPCAQSKFDDSFRTYTLRETTLTNDLLREDIFITEHFIFLKDLKS